MPAVLALGSRCGDPGRVNDAEPEPLSDAAFERALDDHNLREDPAELGTWGWTPGRVLASLLVLAMVLWWVWAFSPLAPRGHPDALEDRAFAIRAEVVCAEALDDVADQVDPAFEAADQSERADQIREATDIFTLMVAELAGFAPDPTTRDGSLVDQWLIDWGIYLEDRYAYADDFSAGIDAAFSVTVVGGGQVTDRIDSFANANGMTSCISPTDV